MQKKYSNEQYRWIRMQFLTESARITHRIFDELINKTWKWVFGAILQNNKNNTEPEFSGFVYDSKNQICIETEDESLYHPIYYCYEWDMSQTYEAYIPTRQVAGVDKQSLEHDPIIIYFNLPRICKSTNSKSTLLASRLPSLIAHELTHAKDMWTVDYINVVDNLVDLGYNVVTEEFLKEEGFTDIPDTVLRKLYAMMYFMSPSETRAKYEEFEKFLNYYSKQEIKKYINEFDYKTDIRALASNILSRIQNVARINISFISLNVGYEEYVKNTIEKGDFTIPVLFTAYCVYMGHIPDSSGYFVDDFSIAHDIIEHKIEPDINLIRMMCLAYEKFEIQQGKFIANIEDIIIQYIEDNHLLDNMQIIDENISPEWNDAQMKNLYNYSLSMYGNLDIQDFQNETISCFKRMIDEHFRDVFVPYCHPIMESGYSDSITLTDLYGMII